MIKGLEWGCERAASCINQLYILPTGQYKYKVKGFYYVIGSVGSKISDLKMLTFTEKSSTHFDGTMDKPNKIKCLRHREWIVYSY